MTRIDLIRSLSDKELGAKIAELDLIDCYCKGTCCTGRGDIECIKENEIECVIKWLQEDVKGGVL